MGGTASCSMSSSGGSWAAGSAPATYGASDSELGGCPSTPPQGHAYYPQLRYAFDTCKKTASPTATSAAASDWGSLLVRRARALARGAAHPSGTGGAALAKPARAGDGLLHGNSQYAHQRRDQPAAAARRRAGGALCDEAASLAIPAPADLRAKNHELLWPSAAELRVCGPFAALGYPEHGPICFSGSRLRMPRAREG